MLEYFEKVFIFIIGAVVGSFLNVCIYRLPRQESIISPASHCPQCQKSIVWYDNIPILSYFFLWGRCRYCKVKISFRYVLVESITAISFVLFYQHFGFSFNLVYYLILICCLIVATFVDLAHRIIPDEVSIGGMLFALVVNILRGISINPLHFSFYPGFMSLLGILVGGGILFSVGWIFDLVYFKILKRPPIQGETESMGGGDIKLLAMIGAFLGWKAALLTFFIAPFLGIFVAIGNLLVRKDHLIPYGPFLSLAAVITIFWQQSILNIFFLPRLF
ncbi:MAG: prepilin peptidase [Candidatus Omnitrophica bacterium]|nr:prepilin peptidase [Candidatus Omnitrophota bacterium]